MTNNSCRVLVAMLIISSICPTAEGGQSQPSVAIITGEIREPTSREVTFGYESPTALGRKSEQRVVLDSRNRFALEVPVTRGTLIMGRYKSRQPGWKWMRWVGAYLFGPPGPLVLFVEPGDSLHVVVDPGYFSTSFRFSGQNAGNSRFIGEWIPRFRTFQRGLDYKDLKVEDFSHKVDQWRSDQFDFLARRREKYALSPGFVDYATAYFNYGWARFMISYPTDYRFANGRKNRDITPEYYDFLKEIPLVDEKAIGVGNYHTFLVRTLDRELDEMPRPSRLSEVYDLSGLELSEETRAQLDSLYEKDGRWPLLSKMVDLEGIGLLQAVQAQLDSLYEKKGKPRLSQMFDLAKLGLSETAQARLDSFFEKSGRSVTTMTSSKVDKPVVDTTGGALVFRLPMKEGTGSLEQLDRTPGLSEEVNLSGLGLSEAAQARLDSLYEHRQPLRLSEKVDLSGLGLSEATQAQLDSIYANSARMWSFSRRYDLASQKLEGRVLYWFLAGELISGFRRGSEAFASVHRKWEDFREINPYPEYNAAVQAALDKALTLQPGRPAPDFTLDDLDGQPVSLSQFRGKVVLLDFWASWCGPCIGNLPYLRRIKEETADQPVVFLNLSLDASETAWRKAIEKHEIKGVHVRSANFGSDAARAYNVRGIPSYFLVDSQGLIVERLSGVMDTDAVVAKIKKSL